jgi:hypothetical protein
MIFDNFPLGPEMFEKAFGAKWGLRIWRVLFICVIAAVFGGLVYAGVGGYDFFRARLVSPPVTMTPTTSATAKQNPDLVAPAPASFPNLPSHPSAGGMHTPKPKMVVPKQDVRTTAPAATVPTIVKPEAKPPCTVTSEAQRGGVTACNVDTVNQ